MYQKEIIYMALHKDGSRLGSAGFLKVENRDQTSSLFLKVKNIPHSIRGRFPVRFYNGTDWKEVDGINLQEGNGLWEESEPELLRQVRLQIILPGGYLIEGISREALQKNQEHGADEAASGKKNVSMTEEKARAFVKEGRMGVPADEGKKDVFMEEEKQGVPVTEGIKGISSEEKETGAAVKEEIKDVAVEEVKRIVPTGEETEIPASENIKTVPVERIPIQKQRRTAPETIQSTAAKAMVSEELPPPMADEMQLDGVKEDKWEQILDTYDQIHPYGDERVYVKLEPKDFVILQAKYQHLVNNSFLLHGFYNYRYVILGKENDYYLGVPGVFYDREKMVALMFGFEAFECQSGEAKPGEFGYYLRKVEL